MHGIRDTRNSVTMKSEMALGLLYTKSKEPGWCDTRKSQTPGGL